MYLNMCECVRVHVHMYKTIKKERKKYIYIYTHTSRQLPNICFGGSTSFFKCKLILAML